MDGVTSTNIMDPGMSLELLHSGVAVHVYRVYGKFLCRAGLAGDNRANVNILC